MAPDEIRIEILTRLAEQAMSDQTFRAIARDDLTAALRTYGYDLNERELSLVLRFRQALEDAGLDLFLTDELSDEQRQQIHQLVEGL